MVLGSTAVARRLASASQLIHADNKIAAAGEPLSETMVRSAIRTAFDAGSDGAETFMVKPTDAELVAEFAGTADRVRRSEEHTSELQSLMRISYAVFCLKKKKPQTST